MSFGTVDLIEVLWTLAALPGLVLWLTNRIIAGRSLRAVIRLRVSNGRMLWARFSVLLTNVFVGVEAVFVLVGGIALFRESTGNDVIRFVLAFALIGASALITWVGWRWRVVDQELVKLGRERKR